MPRPANVIIGQKIKSKKLIILQGTRFFFNLIPIDLDLQATVASDQLLNRPSGINEKILDNNR
jgi:hypothetical protein